MEWILSFQEQKRINSDKLAKLLILIVDSNKVLHSTSNCVDRRVEHKISFKIAFKFFF